MVEKKMALEDIIEERGLSRDTILTHLIRIADTDSAINLDLYKPAEKVLKKVKEQVQKEPQIGLKELYEKLDKKFTYSEIKQALIFRSRWD